ncbi:Sde2 N-terminal domain-containing protein [Artemisia annua]|uniref:Sde2 N-terminal domain-containing protein n=1 Tax=Artemisia annua TaxID=35608 RepID=A0A2U1NY81_ARTAN|nr:Sde2 N-terminal domain-containing protein [Artemisia annua]
MGKRKADDSDIDDMDEEDSDDEMGVENEKSGVTNNENRSDSNKEPNGSLASVNGGKVEGESSVGCSSESASEEEKETVIEEQLGSINESNDKGVDASVGHEESTVNNVDDSIVSFEMEKLAKPELSDSEEKQTELPISSNVQQVETTDVEANCADAKEVINEEKVSTNSNCPELEKPLNFDEFNSAAKMEVLGMERLKSELQERGLKCGGTLQERAARLFLLKTTPLEMLPKKLLAKK